MAIKLPEDGEKPARKVRTTKAAPKREPLQPQDTIDYGLTVEVSLERGRKAWVKYGTTSSVREGETTEQANQRVTDFVNVEIDRRIDALS